VTAGVLGHPGGRSGWSEQQLRGPSVATTDATNEGYHWSSVVNVKDRVCDLVHTGIRPPAIKIRRMVLVYRFRYFDRAQGKLVEAPDMATDSAIRELGAVHVPGSGVMVDESRVSRMGIVRRPAPVEG
jgi:hypothetical protein